MPLQTRLLSFVAPQPLAAPATRRSTPAPPWSRRWRPHHAVAAAPRRARTLASAVPDARGKPPPPPRAAPPIHVMACDMDGTFLTTTKTVTPANVAAVTRLLATTATLFVPATGKSRVGAQRSLGAALAAELTARHPNGLPGVYLQGLLVFAPNGALIFEDRCDDELATTTVALARELDIDLIAYSRDSIVAERVSEFTDLLPSYHEPAVTRIPNWEAAIGKQPLNKFIYMGAPSLIDSIRPTVEKRLAGTCSITQAQDNMLEVLPPNSSKGIGVMHLLDFLDVRPENVLAIGDAENDVELLKMVGYSCAVANALPCVKAVSKYTEFSSNDDSGVAQAIERFLLR